MQTFSTSFRLGFDGGGTKTRAVVIDARAQIVGTGESGASNPYAVGMPAALDHVESAADLALASANLPREAISGWGLGLGGVCSPTESAQVESSLRERVGDRPQIVAVEDVAAAWSGAFGGEIGSEPRAVCIAGTGANCWGKNPHGEVAFADGAGPLLGDRGSGYWIGEQALRFAARACDEGETDNFAAAVLAHFGAHDLKALIRVVYAPAFERSQIAGLVPVVLQYAEIEAAREILHGAGRELALTSLTVLRALSGEESGGVAARGGHAVQVVRGEVALIGGVLAYAEPVKTTFAALLQREAPHARLVAARFEPAIGAALLCQNETAA